MFRLRLSHLSVAVLFTACMILLLSTGSVAQETKTSEIILPEIGSGSVDAYIEALKSDIGAKTRKITEANMQLTAKEAALFWPIYDRYDYDLSKLNYEKSQQYDFYATNYKTLSNKQAEHLLKQLSSIERRKLSLEEKYLREMAKELPAKTVLRFVQISRQVDRLVSLKIMSGIPLVPKEASESKPAAKPKAK